MMSRRIALGILSACGFLPASSVKAEPKDTTHEWHHLRIAPGVETFEELARWIKALPNKQVHGCTTAWCAEARKPHKEIHVSALARPGDEAFVERQVATQVQQKICDEFTDRLGNTIFWRIPLEWEFRDDPQVIEYRDDGPDKDYITDRRCAKDHNWKRIAAYCRFCIADHPET